MVAEVEKAPCRPIEELLRETWKTFPLSPIDPRNDEDKMMLILTEVGVVDVFKNGRTPYTNTILNTLSQSFFFYLLSINFLNEYILTSEDSARAIQTYKYKCTRGN